MLKANIRKRKKKKVNLFRYFNIFISIPLKLLKILPCLCFEKFQVFPQGIFTCPILDFRNIFKNFPVSISIWAEATFSFFFLWVRRDTCHIPNYSFALWICSLLWWPENLLAEEKKKSFILGWGGGSREGKGSGFKKRSGNALTILSLLQKGQRRWMLYFGSQGNFPRPCAMKIGSTVAFLFVSHILFSCFFLRTHNQMKIQDMWSFFFSTRCGERLLL